MPLPVRRLRRWFAAGAILMIAIVAGMYFYARWRVSKAVHMVPAKLGLNIQQTAEGFSISKSEGGRTEFTVSASKAVQFKEGGRAELHDVKIVVYGKDASRFDRIVGDDFEFDPRTGDVTAHGRVLIDLEANPEGMKSSDQAPPARESKPIHLESDGLVFNKNTGDGSSNGRVVFETPEAMGSAVGVEYVSKTGTMTLRSSVVASVHSPHPYQITAEHGVINKGSRTVVLSGAQVKREQQQLQAEQATFFLRNDNTVERVVADGDVEGAFAGKSEAHTRSDHAELLLTGTRNQLTTVTLSGNVRITGEGAQAAEADAGRATLHFGANQVLKTVHADEGVRLEQRRSGSGVGGGLGAVSGSAPASGSAAPSSLIANSQGRGTGSGQDIEMTAPTMDFVVKNGNQVEFAETSGPPEIVITQPGTSGKTVVTADRFTGKFTEQNRLSLLHGEPNTKIVESVAGQPDRVSTSPTLDVQFQPQGGISTVTQGGGLVYVSGTQKAWAERGTYSEADQTLQLTGAPRVADGSMTTTAQTIRFNRTTGDAVAEGNVKSTYSDLKPQPDGGMLAASDPIHVVSRSMTAHRSSAVAVYTGNAKLWQNSNVVEAPTLEFNRDRRSLAAEANASQTVKTVLVQVDSSGKATPVTITTANLTYTDAERKIVLTGGVTAKGADATMTARLMTVYLVSRAEPHSGAGRGTTSGQAVAGQAGVGQMGAGQVERIVAEKDVVIEEPARRATGDRLVYTAADEKFVLTGGPPSIFDAERGKITGDSLTFYKRDDRVLVEGRTTSPAVTRTQVER